MSHLLEVKDLRTYYYHHTHIVRAVDGLDFHLDKGEILGIVGESGCGKSQTSMSIMNLIQTPPGKIETGEILYDGTDLLKMQEEEMRKIRGNRIFMIFQEPMTSLNPLFTLGNQISEVLLLHRGMTEQEARSESINLLDMVGMSDPDERVDEYPFQLSGGLRQRGMIAMAMACEPSILIADEPTTALDVTIQAQILRLMGSLKEKRDTSIIFITHDLAVIAGFTDRVMVMYAGVAVESTDVKTIFKKPFHPYTQGLLTSIPVLGEGKTNADGTRRKLNTILGNLPDHTDFPKGCRFAPRCQKAMEKCFVVEPKLVEIENNHFVRCFLYHNEEKEGEDLAAKIMEDRKNKRGFRLRTRG
jgi:peptide/nickel transport system ATP-binding protein